MLFRSIVFLVLIPSCSLFKRDQKPEEKELALPPSALVERGDFYCSASKSAYESLGYVHSKCDGSGFTSLYSIRCPGVDLSGFTDEQGKLWRSKTKDCFINKESKSESSRDMWLMRMSAAWVHKDLPWVVLANSFVERNHGDICEAETPAIQIARCTMTPQLTALLKAMKSKLETGETPLRLELVAGEDDALPLPVNSDYQAHLDVLRIWLSGEVYGAITKAEKDLLAHYAARETKNALFQAVSNLYHGKDMAEVWPILETWPKDRLPGTQDWSEPYLWQRNLNKFGETSPEWLPGTPPHIPHDGADFNFALYVASGGK